MLLFDIFSAYIFVLLWIDINLLEVKSSIYKQSTSKNVTLSQSDLIEDVVEPGNTLNHKLVLHFCTQLKLKFYFEDNIPDLEAVYEDFSITDEFKIDNVLLEYSESLNESKYFVCSTRKLINFFIILDIVGSEDSYGTNYMKAEEGEEATEQEMDVISLSSSTLSDFDVITEEEIHLLK